MQQDLETDEKTRERVNRLCQMAEAVFTARKLVISGTTRKAIAFAEAMGRLPRSFKDAADQRGNDLVFTGDNWLWKDPQSNEEEALYPDLTASIALTERDQSGKIVCAAICILDGDPTAIVADGIRAYEYLVTGELIPIESVNASLLGHPIRAFVFGQKTKPHWVAMNRVVAGLNERGIRTSNDCGPYFGFRGWFGGRANSPNTPMNAVYCEPYAVKLKEQIMPFVIVSLNARLPESERFAVLAMDGTPLYGELGEHGQQGIDEKYDSSGFVIAPTMAAAEEFLTAMANVVLNDISFVTAEHDSKMRLLAEQLARYHP